MGAPLRVLILEDRAADAELLVLELTRAGFAPTWQVTDTPGAYLQALAEQPQVIIADYAMPQFTAIDALTMLHAQGYDIPLIVVSGAMSEESCVEALRHGAADYLLKDRLARLGPAIEHALNQRRLVAERRRAELASSEHERRFRAAFDRAPVGMALTTMDGHVVEANHALTQITGYAADEIRGRALGDLVAPASRAVTEEAAVTRTGVAREIRLAHAAGREVWAQYSASVIGEAANVGRHVIHQFADVTDRRRTERALQDQAAELARANQELLETDRLKSEFVATVSHELRTPLTSIRGYTEILADMAGEPGSPQRRIIDIIDRNGQRLLALIEDLLTFSRVEAGTLHITPEPVDMAALVARAADLVAPAVEAAGLTLKLDPGSDLPLVPADEPLIERVLLNLLSNAVKFSTAGGVVTLHAGVEAGHVVVSVADTGMGIPHEEHSRLFTRFYRASGAREQAIQGTGLGLAICKAIVEAHDGWLGVVSAPGEGSTFTLGLSI